MATVIRDPENRIEVEYCNDASTESTFTDSGFGDLQAREAYHEFCLQGRDNDKIWAKYPHVIQVSIYLVKEPDPITDRFTCPCGKQKEKLG